MMTLQQLCATTLLPFDHDQISAQTLEHTAVIAENYRGRILDAIPYQLIHKAASASEGVRNQFFGKLGRFAQIRLSKNPESLESPDSKIVKIQAHGGAGGTSFFPIYLIHLVDSKFSIEFMRVVLKSHVCFSVVWFNIDSVIDSIRGFQFLIDLYRKHPQLGFSINLSFSDPRMILQIRDLFPSAKPFDQSRLVISRLSITGFQINQNHLNILTERFKNIRKLSFC